MESFDANKPVPQSIAFNSIDNHLYRIGLSLISKNEEKRSRFYNPLLILIVNTICLIKSIVSLLLSEENEKLLIINGDFAHFLGSKTHLNVPVLLGFLLTLIQQFIYYYNSKNDINLTDLKLFDMMSGLVSPKSIGLTNGEEIYKLIKESKLWFSFCRCNIQILVPIFGLSNLLPFVLNCSAWDTIIFGIPHSLLFAIGLHYVCTINVWQIFYFLLICRYIKIKFKESNDIVSQLIFRRKLIKWEKVSTIIRNLDAKYSELDKFNQEFWSKYLLSIWLMAGTIINFSLYSVFFSEMNLINKLMSGYSTVFAFLAFIFIITNASSVNYEANKMYKLLNHIMVYNSSSRLRFSRRNHLMIAYSTKIKVKSYLIIKLEFYKKKKKKKK
jgi:hypothetical protein